MDRTESSIEQACRQYAVSMGAILLKIQGSKGFPDRLLLYNGMATFIEFKRPGHVPTPLQMYILEDLTKRGYLAIWITSLQTFKELLNAPNKGSDS